MKPNPPSCLDVAASLGRKESFGERQKPDCWLFPLTRTLLGWFWDTWSHVLETLGFATLYGRHAVIYALKGRCGVRHFFQQASFVGVESLPVALLLNITVAMVLALQVAGEMDKQGGGNFVGALVSMAMVRELGPVMTGFAVIAMAGSAFAAEITTMKSNAQLDALKIMKVDPIRYLMLPRVLGMVAMLPLMTLLATTLGVLAGGWVANVSAGIPLGTFFDSAYDQTKPYDLLVLGVKSFIFAITIATLCCSIGFTSGSTGLEVARSTTKAVVWSFIAMALLDYLLTMVLFN
jgi:phospholipid/cholesterol/gamma-HCH transport system permease protein